MGRDPLPRAVDVDGARVGPLERGALEAPREDQRVDDALERRPLQGRHGDVSLHAIAVRVRAELQHLPRLVPRAPLVRDGGVRRPGRAPARPSASVARTQATTRSCSAGESTSSTTRGGGATGGHGEEDGAADGGGGGGGGSEAASRGGSDASATAPDALGAAALDAEAPIGPDGARARAGSGERRRGISTRPRTRSPGREVRLGNNVVRFGHYPRMNKM